MLMIKIQKMTNKLKKYVIPVFPVSRRLFSSSCSSSSSYRSSSYSSSTSSADDSVNSIPTRQDLNTVTNPISTGNEQSIEAQGISRIKDTEVSITTLEEGMEIYKKKS